MPPWSPVAHSERQAGQVRRVTGADRIQVTGNHSTIADDCTMEKAEQHSSFPSPTQSTRGKYRRLAHNKRNADRHSLSQVKVITRELNDLWGTLGFSTQVMWEPSPYDFVT